MWPFSRKKAPEPEPVAPPPPPPESELARLQREVFERIVDGKPGPVGIDDWRLQIYAGMYEARTHDALIEDVPHTAKLLGGEFAAVVKRYVADLPSTHYSLARLGHGFAKWLREHPVVRTETPRSTAPSATETPPSSTAPSSTAPSSTAPSSTAPSSTAPDATAPSSPAIAPDATAADASAPAAIVAAADSHGHVHAPASSEHATRPDLADLAELEWARSESFVADNFTPVEPEIVQQMGPERFTQAWMQFVPSLRVVELSHRVDGLWKALESGAPLTPALSPLGERECVVVWRKGFEVFHAVIAEDELAAIKAAQARETVAQICERFAGRGDDAAHAAFQAIGSWLSEGMVAALREPAGPQDTFGL